MKIAKRFYLLLGLLICTVLVLYILRCVALQNSKTGYRPMVYINNELYGDAGIGVDSPPDGFLRAGAIKEKVLDTKPMIEKNYVSNTLDVGTEIYANKNMPDKIYIKLDSKKYIQYVKIE